jgi:hypothetical protein
MDGKTLSQIFLDAVDKAEGDLVELQPRVIYQALDLAACEFARLTRMLINTVTIATVDGQSRYDLPPDFLSISAVAGKMLGKFTATDGSVSWPCAVPEAAIFADESNADEDSPSAFAVVNRLSSETRISGTTTAVGAAAGGEATLTEAGKTFAATVEVRDRVHNTTKQSDGIVLSVTSNTAIACAMFGGISSGFGSGDAYVIVPGATLQVLLDRVSDANAETLQIPYVAAPRPVFSDYGVWPFPEHTCRAICEEAAFKYLTDKKRGKPRPEWRGGFSREVLQTKREIALNVLRGM